MKGQRRSRQSSRQLWLANRFGLLVVLFMLFSSVFATVGNIQPVAAAQPDQCSDGEEYNADTQECESTNDLQPDDSTDDGTVDASNDGTDDAADTTNDGTDDSSNDDSSGQDVGTGAIDIYKFECGTEFSAGNASFDDFDANCDNPQENVNFELYDGQNLVDSGSSGGDGHVGFSGLDATSYVVAEGVPDGYGAPYIFCATGSDPNSLGSYNSYDVAEGFYTQVDLSYDSYAVCYWYNMPNYFGSITIYKYLCDDTSVALSRGPWGLDDYQQNCHGSLDDYDILFELTDADSVASSQNVGDQIDDGIYWEEGDYAPGNMTIKEYPTEGFGSAVVFCGVVPAGTDAPLQPSQMEVTDLAVAVSIDPGQQFVCYWFNLPNYNQITIIKYLCPDGYAAPADGTSTGLFENCTQYQDDVPFTLSNTDGYSENGQTGDDGDGTLAFAELDPGTYTITEEVPEGYGTPYVSCSFDFRVLQSGDTASRRIDPGASPAEDGTYELDYTQGGPIVCVWFNFPTTHNVTIYKYSCHDDFVVVNKSLDDFLTECTTPESRVEFTLDNGDDYSESATTGDVADGLAALDDVPEGSYTLTETIPDGYGFPYIFCDYVSTEPLSGSPALADDGAYQFDYDGSRQIVCYVFNIPSTYTITIVKYFCRDGYSENDYGFDAVYAACGNEEFSGFDFGIEGDNGYSGSGETDDDGLVSFPLDSGDPATYTVTETIPDGYGTPYWYCTYQSPENIDQFTDDLTPATDGAFEVSYPESGHLYCYVYNFPTTYTITIVKYYCDDGYTPESYALSTLYQDCGDNWFSDVHFGIEGDNGYAGDGETDDSGTLAFGLDSGDAATYTVTETIPDGYGDPYWYCTYRAPEDVAQIDDEASLAAAGQFDAEYSESGHLYCYVFNFKTYYGIDIYKWECPPTYAYAADAAYTDLKQNCTLAKDDVDFSLGNGSETYDSGTTGDDGSGHLIFPTYQPGDMVITETIPDGYRTPIVYCSIESDLQTLVADIEQYDVADDGSITGTLEENWHLICDWFNFPTDHDVTIYKFYCESGYQPSTIAYETYGAECTTTQPGATFHLGDQDKSVGTEDQPADGVYFDDVAPGELTIAEDLPDGYLVPVVFCIQVATGGDMLLLEAPSQVDVSESGEFTYTLDDGYRLICYVFNIPTGHDVTIYKYYCDPGYRPEAATYGTYFNNCTTTRPGTMFSLNGEEKTVGADGQPADSVYYDDVATGDLTMGEQQVDGYVIPIVYCVLIPTTGGEQMAVTPEEVQVTEDWQFNYTLDEGYRLVCYVFNIPTGHEVIVYKFICPYGVDYSDASIEYLREQCEVITIPIPFDLYSGDELLQSQSTGSVIPGGVVFTTTATGLRITENMPTGYEDPRVYCRVETTPTEGTILYTAADDLEEMTVDGTTVQLGDDLTAAEDTEYRWWCEWYNFKAQDDNNTVTIHKWECPVFPADMVIEDSQGWLLEHCTDAFPGVTFTLDDLNGPRDLETGDDGIVEWTDVVNGPVTITETIPEGYGEPTVYCGWTATRPGNPPVVIDAFPAKVDSPGGVVTTSLDYPGTTYFCDWFNWPEQPGDITIYKWTCPEGYDLYAYGADPAEDCRTATNGIDYTLDGGQETTTGDSIDGAVYWGDLEPGDYTITEDMPSNTDYVFILHCDGARFPGIQPYPLQFGNELAVKLVSADHIVCYWYNVPRPDDGWVTVYKYWCSTKTYKSDVDCQIYEDGVKLELWQHGGGKIDDGITSEVGKLTFSGISEGNYDLKEPGWKWCAIDIAKKGPDNSIAVQAGQETVVKVYNCDLPDKPKDPNTPKDPNVPTKPNPKQPTKYPNTGVDPTVLQLPSTGVGPLSTGTDMVIIGLLGSLALVLVIAGLAVSRQTPPAPPVRSGPRYSMRRRHGAVATALLAVIAPTLVVAAQGDDPGSDEETDGTPAATPDVPACRVDIPPDATPEADAACIRGEVPTHIAIDAIGVEADIEIQEIIAGELADPTGPTLVTWYKETSRLGERGNGVYAGHLNYWGVPEGVFFAIKTLQPGDEIVLTGANGEDFTYAVVWVENQPGQEPPSAEVLGPTEEESITLITCGGEWDTTIAEYNERTTVRAVRQEVEPA
jgi:sortase (surface protein transpeptidase)